MTGKPRSSEAPASPVRDTVRDYTRDSYVRGKSMSEACAPLAVAGDLIDCATGIFHFEPSPRAARALRDFHIERLDDYTPLADEWRLKRTILDWFKADLDAAQLFLGHGSFNLFERLIHKFLKPVAMAGIGPQFTEVPSEFVAAGGRYQSIPLGESDGALPLKALLAAVSSNTYSVLYIDNPNNPLGCSFAPEVLDRLAAACDRHGVAMLVDEAFGDYLDNRLSAIHLVPRHRNLLVVRSFSKAFGLAAERVGYMAMSAELARCYRQIDVPFEPGIVAQTLAIETLYDAAWIRQIRREARRAKARMTAALAKTDIRVLPTHPDVAIMALQRPGHDLACDFHRQGIIVLPGSGFARTHPGWDDSYCRLRVVRGGRLADICRRLAAL